MNYVEQFIKDNGIKVNEEFYITHNNRIFRRLDEDEIIFFFNEESQLKEKIDDQDYDNSVLLVGLMSGEYKIEKITKKPKSVWDLTEEDMYYYINLYGEIDSTFYDCDEDVDIIKCGNAFLTREEAEHEVERRKCESILLKYGTRNFMSFEYYDDKYYIMYNNTLENVYVDCCNFMQIQGSIYFKTKELAQKAIEECGEERLKKYIFNVKE